MNPMKKMKHARQSDFSLLFSLPQHLQISIAIHVAHHRVLNLGPLIVAGKRGQALALHPHVLKEASLDYLAFQATLLNEGSQYRHLLIRCVEAGNITACYLEGLRIAAKHGDMESSLQLLQERPPTNLNMSFANALFLFAAGRDEEGEAAINAFKSLVGFFDRGVGISQQVYWDLHVIGVENRLVFCHSWQEHMLFPPLCATNYPLCTYYQSCERCLKWWNNPTWASSRPYPPHRPRGCVFEKINNACENCIVWWRSYWR